MTAYEGLKVLCETTFDDFPQETLEFWIRSLVKEHGELLNKPDTLDHYFEEQEKYKDY